jgi:hypothetical protein
VRAFEAQQAFFNRISKEFRANNHDLRRIIKAVVRSPWYRAVDVEGEGELDDARKAELWEVGSGKRLGPELLTRKVHAVMGVPWRSSRDSTDHLMRLDEYRILYGGIDYDDVITRLEGTNGIMFAIQHLMANDMACRSAAYDFAKDPENRLLFPHVDTEFVPRDVNGFDVPGAQEAIRRNIQYLHAHILNEELDLDDLEVEATWQLFLATWEEGRALMEAEELGATIPSGNCRAERDYWTLEPLENQIRVDPNYTIRAWQAVLAYLLMDYKFVVEE